MGAYRRRSGRVWDLRVSGYLILPWILAYALIAIGAPSPHIERVTAGPGNEITIAGKNFGPGCPTCEIIIQYPDGFRYTHPALSWSERRIVAIIPDINKGLDVQMFLRTSHGNTNPVPYRLSPHVVPAKEVTRPVRPGTPGGPLVFEASHTLLEGDRGEDEFDVSSIPPACGQRGLVFDHAKLVFKQRRFGDAQITAMPSPGCLNCPPLKVRWYHEPTGKLEYQLHVYRREVEGICKERLG